MVSFFFDILAHATPAINGELREALPSPKSERWTGGSFCDTFLMLFV